MAKLKMYAVWDNAVGSYSAPHCAVTRGVAVRNFIDYCSKSDSEIAKHPKDFSLFEMGEYDDVTGVVENAAAPVNLGSAASFVAKNSDLVN